MIHSSRFGVALATVGGSYPSRRRRRRRRERGIARRLRRRRTCSGSDGRSFRLRSSAPTKRHPPSDLVLAPIGPTLRQEQPAFRLGGDERGVVLQGVGSQALETAQSIVARIG